MAVGRVYEGDGRGGVAGTGREGSLDGIGLVRAGGEDGDLAGAVERRQGQGDAVGVQVGDPVGGYESLTLFQRRGAGEEGGGVAVVADAEEGEVQPAVGGESVGEGEGVVVGGLLRRAFSHHAVHLRRRDGDVVEEGASGHAEVAVGVVWRHAALVAPEDVPARPVDVVGKRRRGEQPVEGSGGGAAGQRDGEPASGRYAVRR